MYKIRGSFIKANDGSWHNYKLIRKFYVGGCPDVGYRICFTIEGFVGSTKYFVDSESFGGTQNSLEEAEQFLDTLMDLFEQEET